MGFWWSFILSLKVDHGSQPCSKIILLRKAPRISHASTTESWIPVDSQFSHFCCSCEIRVDPPATLALLTVTLSLLLALGHQKLKNKKENIATKKTFKLTLDN